MVTVINRFVSESLTVELTYTECGDKTDPWTYDEWYDVKAVQSGVTNTKNFNTLEEATVAFNELCKNGFDVEAVREAHRIAEEKWALIESEFCTDDYSIEE